MIALFGAGDGSARPAPTCGGAPILDLALCLILSVTVVGLLLLAL
ncbi:hypothetical protein [Methylobacterium mesophilicum]|nr:hypothetical protein [Methylobacterium mesophilicum]